MLRYIRDADAASESIDSQSVARRLGWADERTANVLAEARAAMLIWGVRVGGRPAPCFADLELTVQGQRLLRGQDEHRPSARSE